MKQVIIGTYYSGYEQVELVLREGLGAEFYFCPENKHVARIKVGVDQYEWWQVINALMHEILEFNLARLSGRFYQTEYVCKDTGAFTFMFGHGTFTEATARSAEYMADALPELEKEWKKWKKGKKKNKKT